MLNLKKLLSSITSRYRCNFVFKKNNLLLIAFTLFIFQYTLSQSNNWKRTNPGGGGWFSCIGASKSGIILVGSDLSGAYRSKDGGKTWDVCGFSKGINATHVSGIGFHRTDGDIMFVGANGVHKTIDGGDSWYKVLNPSGYVTDIEFGTNNPAIGYTSSHKGPWSSTNAEIYKTTDTGESWEKIGDSFANTRILEVILDPQNANNVYLLTGRSRAACTEADVYKSTNGGVSWTNITANSDFEGFKEVGDFAIDPNNSDTMYLTTLDASCDNRWWINGFKSKLFKSTNGGNTWFKIQDQGGVIHINPNNSHITTLELRGTAPWNPTSGTRLSTNGGNSFTKISDESTWEAMFTGDVSSTYGGTSDGYSRVVGEDLSNPNNYYSYTNQWVTGTKDGGRNFKVLHGNKVGDKGWQSTGVDNLVNIDMVISPKNPNIIYLALADMGVWRSIDKGVSWENCNTVSDKHGWGNKKGGNFHAILADPDRENVVWATTKRGYILKNTNTGQSEDWTEVNNGVELSASANGLSVDPNSPINNRILYLTSDGSVYKSSNDGNNWQKVLDDKFCNFTAVDQFNSNIVYAGGSKGLWKSVDKGSNWNKVTALNDLPADHNEKVIRSTNYRGVYDIVTDPNNENWVYVTVHGKGEDKGLYRSKNQGDSWVKLLSDKYMRQVAVMPKNSNVIYATSSSAIGSGGLIAGTGIWFTYDGGLNWTKEEQNPAYPAFNSIDISNEDYPYVLAGSQGSGFQKANIPIISNDGVTLFQNCDYTGTKATFGVGTYGFPEFTAQFPNDQLSSIAIPACFKVTLYRNDLSGTTIELTGSDSCLENDNFNDVTSSIKVELINTNACGTLSNDTEDIVKRPLVYPNPVKNTLNIQFQSLPTAPVKYTIINMIGQEIFGGEFKNQNSKVDVNSLENGMYFLSIEHSTKVTITKFLVSK